MKKVTCLTIFLGAFFILEIISGYVVKEARADTYSIEELNQMRYEAQLPMLTGNPRIDIPRLSYECNNGTRFSCTFLPQKSHKNYQNNNYRIIPLPSIEKESVQPRYQENNNGKIIPLPPPQFNDLGTPSQNYSICDQIIPLPQLSENQEEYSRKMHQIEQRDIICKKRDVNQKRLDEMKNRRDAEQQKRDLDRIERMFPNSK